MILGVSLCMKEGLCLGFGWFNVDYRVFYGFWGWIDECGGHCKVIHGFLGIFGGFFRGLRGNFG